MNAIFHLNAGALEHQPFYRDDHDRSNVLRRVVDAYGGRLLAYCLMNTHIHLLVMGREPELKALAARSLGGYARSYNARHARLGVLLRGDVLFVPVPEGFEVARTVRYIHHNPLKTNPPLVTR